MGRMWDLIISVPDHCLSFYFDDKAGINISNEIVFNMWILSKRENLGETLANLIWSPSGLLGIFFFNLFQIHIQEEDIWRQLSL